MQLSPGPSTTDNAGDPDFRVQVMPLSTPCLYGSGEYLRDLGTMAGRDRYYEIHVPPGYVPGTPTPVVMVLHGGGSNPDIVRFESQMDPVSDANGFIVVYPAATSPIWTTYPLEPAGGAANRVYFTNKLLYWHNGFPMAISNQNGIDDIAYFQALLADIGNYFSVDSNRVYASGLSCGGAMSYYLGANLTSAIAAIASWATKENPFFKAPRLLRRYRSFRSMGNWTPTIRRTTVAALPP